LPLRYRRVNGVLPKRARAISWWGLVQRRSTKEEGGVQVEAEGLAQAVGRPAEGAGAGGASAADEALSAGAEAEESVEVGVEGEGAGEPPQARAGARARARARRIREMGPTRRDGSMGGD
jgi:hypothetical protein